MRKILLIFLIPIAGYLAQPKWKISDQMPYPVAGAQSLVWGNLIYIVGGYSEKNQQNESWIQTYNVISNSWGGYNDMAYPRYGLNAAIKADTVYCYGGIHDTSSSNTTLEKWGIDFSASSSIFDNQSNFNRIFSSGTIVGDNYYIIGGNPYLNIDSSWFPYIVEYNTITKNITFELEDSTFGEELPEQQMIAVIDSDIYIFGGVMNGLPSKKIYRFSTVTHEFETLPNELYEPRAGGIAVEGFKQGEIILIGGYHEQSPALNSVEVFRKEGEYFSVFPAPGTNIARKQLVGEKVNDVIYLFGGYDENGDWVDEVELFSTVTASEEIRDKGKLTFSLNQNYPNPFNPATKIKFTIPSVADALNASTTNVLLKIYDILGNDIATLVDEQKQPGSYTADFNANGLANGIYFYKLTINSIAAGSKNSYSDTKKMVLLK